MAITASNMRALAENNEYRINGKSYSDLLIIQDRMIYDAAIEGKTRCPFLVHDTIYDMFEQRMKDYYYERGFTFKPVGIIGGVRQRDEYICW